MASLYLIFYHFEDGELSIRITTVTASIFSLCLFTTGILWIDGDYFFDAFICDLFHITHILESSRKVGGAMLIASGYVVTYAIFHTIELISPSKRVGNSNV